MKSQMLLLASCLASLAVLVKADDCSSVSATFYFDDSCRYEVDSFNSMFKGFITDSLVQDMNTCKYVSYTESTQTFEQDVKIDCNTTGLNATLFGSTDGSCGGGGSKHPFYTWNTCLVWPR